MTYLPINGPIPPTAFGLPLPPARPTAQTKADELCRQMDALISAAQEISAKVTATRDITDFEDYLMEMMALSVQASALTARAVLFATAEIPALTCMFCETRPAVSVPGCDFDICELCYEAITAP